MQHVFSRVVYSRLFNNGSFDSTFDPDETSPDGIIVGAEESADVDVTTNLSVGAADDLVLLQVNGLRFFDLSDGSRSSSLVDDFDNVQFTPISDAIVRQLDGRVILAGRIGSAGDQHAAIVRLDDHLAADESFADHGLLDLGPVSGIESGGGVALGADGTPEFAFNSGTPSASLGDDTREIRLARFFTDNKPVAILTHAKSITSETQSSAVFLVQFRADAPIDTTTLDNRDLRITGPDGFVSYARFFDVIAHNGSNTILTAQYKLGPPTGTWTSADNGSYSIRLRGDGVADVEGDFAAARLLGHLLVSISPGSAFPPA